MERFRWYFAPFLQDICPEDLIRGKYPLGLGRAPDVAYAIIFLLAEAGPWITGSTLIVDGGYSAC